MKQDFPVTTANAFEGFRITDYLGVVRGIVVRSPGIGRSILGGLKSVIGGNIGSYESVCDEAREHAFERMVQHARERGADGIVAMSYDATEFMSGITEVLAYGTAVKFVRA